MRIYSNFQEKIRNMIHFLGNMYIENGRFPFFRNYICPLIYTYHMYRMVPPSCKLV